MLPPLLLNAARHHAVNGYSEEAAAGDITWHKRRKYLAELIPRNNKVGVS